jgi:transposase
VTLSSADLVGGVADDGVVAKKKQPGSRADRPKRRSFTPEYKLAIVAEYEQLTEPGARGALLRREGLYHSHLIEWKRLRDAGSLNALAAKPSGPKPAKSEADKRAEKLEAENARLAAELAKTQKALKILGKVHEVLDLLSKTSDDEQNPPR